MNLIATSIKFENCRVASQASPYFGYALQHTLVGVSARDNGLNPKQGNSNKSAFSHPKPEEISNSGPKNLQRCTIQYQAMVAHS